MKLLWLQSGGCGGCTLSWLGYEHGPLFQVLADEGVELVWHPSVSEASVDEALELISHCADGQIDLDVLCIEGSLLRGPQGTGAYHRFGGGDRSMAEWVRQIARRARHVVAIGSCSAFGGVTAAGINPTDACGLQYDGELDGGLLGPDFRDLSGLPVINIAGCPPHPDWRCGTSRGKSKRSSPEGRRTKGRIRVLPARQVSLRLGWRRPSLLPAPACGAATSRAILPAAHRAAPARLQP